MRFCECGVYWRSRGIIDRSCWNCGSHVTRPGYPNWRNQTYWSAGDSTREGL